jgi:hypothetical protein
MKYSTLLTSEPAGDTLMGRLMMMMTTIRDRLQGVGDGDNLGG